MTTLYAIGGFLLALMAAIFAAFRWGKSSENASIKEGVLDNAKKAKEIGNKVDAMPDSDGADRLRKWRK